MVNVKYIKHMLHEQADGMHIFDRCNEAMGTLFDINLRAPLQTLLLRMSNKTLDDQVSVSLHYVWLLSCLKSVAMLWSCS